MLSARYFLHSSCETAMQSATFYLEPLIEEQTFLEIIDDQTIIRIAIVTLTRRGMMTMIFRYALFLICGEYTSRKTLKLL